MSRDNYNQGHGAMGNNHDQNQMVKRAAREVGISERELSERVHEEKDSWYGGDFTYTELVELAMEIKRNQKR